MVAGLMAGCLTCGCGSSAQNGDTETAGTASDPVAENGAGVEASSASTASDPEPPVQSGSNLEPSVPEVASPGDVRAHQVMGVRLFSNAATDYDQALLIQPAAIVSDCLLVGDFVVIWHESRLREAENAVATLKAGGTATLKVGGSGTTVPNAVVSMNCAGYPIWFGSPEVP